MAHAIRHSSPRSGAPVPRPTRPRVSTLLALLLGLGSTLAPSARAQAWINVSELVTGTEQALPSVVTREPCGSRCRSVFVATAALDDSYTQQPTPVFAGNWPALYTLGSATLAGIGIGSALIAPGAPYTGFDWQSTPVGRQARINFSTDLYGGPIPDRLSVQTWATGSGTAVMSFGARVQLPATQSRRVYLSFAVPQVAASVQTSRTAHDNGATQHHRPTRAHSRVAVDVYVNGLPVWNMEQAVLFPGRHVNSGSNPLRLKWGPALEGDRIRLFLGTLPANSQHQVAVVFRGDTRASAGTCRTYTSAGEELQSYHAQHMSFSLPAMRRNDGAMATALQMRPDIAVEMQP